MQEDERKREAQRIGDLLRQLRIQQRWTQADVGTVAKIRQTYISQVERGEMVPTTAVQQRLARALGVPVDTFASSVPDHRYQPRSRPNKDATRTPFGTLINQARMRHQWTRKQVATSVGLPLSKIAAYEDGRQLPSDRTTVEQFARVLELEEETLWQVCSPPRDLADSIDSTLKECTRCHQPQPHSNFHKHKQSADGYYPRCKICREDVRQHQKRQHTSDPKPEPEQETTIN